MSAEDRPLIHVFGRLKKKASKSDRCCDCGPCKSVPRPQSIEDFANPLLMTGVAAARSTLCERFDLSNEEHEALLRKCWQLWKPETPLPGLAGEHWETLGFQSARPENDFRGAGLRGLRALVHLGEKYPAVVKHGLQRTAKSEYYFATSCIVLWWNIVCHLQLSKKRAARAPDKTSLEAVSPAPRRDLQVFCRLGGASDDGDVLYTLFGIGCRVMDREFEHVREQMRRPGFAADLRSIGVEHADRIAAMPDPWMLFDNVVVRRTWLVLEDLLWHEPATTEELTKLAGNLYFAQSESQPTRFAVTAAE